MAEFLGRNTFSPADQQRFAALSGDANPMHMDPLAARRTQAGAPVVHGIHVMLRGFDLLARSQPDLPPIARLKTSFNKLIYVGDSVDYQLVQLSEKTATVDAAVDGNPLTRIIFTFGPPAEAPALFAADAPAEMQAAPADLSLSDMAGRQGRIAVPATAADITAAFPAAAKAWSAPRLLACLATTTLVGMVCPGLHSIYGNFTLHAVHADAAEPLAWRVMLADARVRLVRLAVQGGGVAGTVDSFVRMPPTAQAAMADLAGLVGAQEFAGSLALVAGGSRGLGELTAKFLAAGGARVIITYAAGRADAETLAAAITAWGGDCTALPYDARQPAAPQLTALPAPPTHLYYFATPPIFRRKSGLFDAARHAELQQFYVTGFHDLFMALHAAAPAGLAAFYPSSVAVADRPADMTEYAMAKAAGEILAADLTAHLPRARIVTARLPRLPTDQTATVVQADTADPIAVMLPIIRAVQGGPR
jgi:NAD(P)-dependent dehydrogenase (short-subunit alcohol dehydrogenase family)